MERILYGVIAAFLWCLFGAYLINRMGAVIPNDLQLLTTAIVFAGAMAGGD